MFFADPVETELEKSADELLAEQITAQLDVFVFPTGHDSGDLKRELEILGVKSPTEKETKIVWERLQDLLRLAKKYDGTVYRSKKGTFGKAPPYFVAIIKFRGMTCAIAESPVVDNATYATTDTPAGTFLEILQLRRIDAAQVGAISVPHHAASPHGEAHTDKVEAKLEILHERFGLPG